MGSYSQARIAVLPGGDVAEVIIQSAGGYVAAHWHDGSRWLDWHLIDSGAVDVSIAAAGVDAAYISVLAGTPSEPPIRSRSVYRFTVSGFERLGIFD